MGVLYARAERERTEAKRQARIAQAVNEFLNQDLLAAADPSRNADRDVTMRSVVDIASAKVKGRFPNEPLVEAAIRRTLGQTYMGLGAVRAGRGTPEGRARPLCEGERRRERGDAPHGDPRRDHGPAPGQIRRRREPRSRATGEAQRRVLGDVAPRTRSTRWPPSPASTTRRGGSTRRTRVIRPVVAAAKRGLGEDAEITMSAMNTAAMVARRPGTPATRRRRPTSGCSSCERKKLGTDDAPIVLQTLNNLGQVYLELDRLEDAERVTGDALARGRRVLGNEHKETLNYVNNLGIIERRLGKTAEAEALYREAYESSRRAVRRRDALDTLISMSNLATLLRQDRPVRGAGGVPGERRGARPEARPARHARRWASPCRAAGDCHLSWDGRRGRAALLESEALLVKIHGPDSPRVVEVRKSLAETYAKLGQPTRAAEWKRKAEAPPPGDK